MEFILFVVLGFLVVHYLIKRQNRLDQPTDTKEALDEHNAKVDGKTWEWVGNCPCRGQDFDCARDDKNWVEK